MKSLPTCEEGISKIMMTNQKEEKNWRKKVGIEEKYKRVVLENILRNLNEFWLVRRVCSTNFHPKNPTSDCDCVRCVLLEKFVVLDCSTLYVKA